MNPTTLETLLTALEQDSRPSFTTRQNGLGLLASTFEAIDASPALFPDATLARLQTLQIKFKTLDKELFQKIRAKVQKGLYTPSSFRAELERLTDFVRWNPNETRHTFDTVDILFNGLIELDDKALIYQPTVDPEMVYYGPTPARIILAVADYADLQANDVIYDLGSGTGRVPLLLHLVTGIATTGVEYDPRLHELAEHGKSLLSLPKVTFIQGDARTADYSDGTVFYMFTPFQGVMFQTVLDRIKDEAAKRPIKVIAHGGCIATVQDQPWLAEKTPPALGNYRMAVFENQT